MYEDPRVCFLFHQNAFSMFDAPFFPLKKKEEITINKHNPLHLSPKKSIMPCKIIVTFLVLFWSTNCVNIFIHCDSRDQCLYKVDFPIKSSRQNWTDSGISSFIKNRVQVWDIIDIEILYT